MAAERSPGSNRGRAAIDWQAAFLFYASPPADPIDPTERKLQVLRALEDAGVLGRLLHPDQHQERDDGGGGNEGGGGDDGGGGEDGAGEGGGAGRDLADEREREVA